MGLEDDLEIISEKDTPEAVCQKYDAFRNKKMEMIYNGKRETILLPCIMLYVSITGK